MNRIESSKAAALVLATLLLAACGGGGYDTVTVSPTPPADDGLTQAQRDDRAASASVGGLFSFAVALMGGQTSDSTEPRAIDGISPPVSDEIEPTAVPQ